MAGILLSCLHLIYWGRISHLKQELAKTASVAIQHALGSCLCLLNTRNRAEQVPSIYVGLLDQDSAPHICTVSTLTLESYPQAPPHPTANADCLKLSWSQGKYLWRELLQVCWGCLAHHSRGMAEAAHLGSGHREPDINMIYFFLSFFKSSDWVCIPCLMPLPDALLQRDTKYMRGTQAPGLTE